VAEDKRRGCDDVPVQVLNLELRFGRAANERLEKRIGG
jgi:hypothetical protein